MRRIHVAIVIGSFIASFVGGVYGCGSEETSGSRLGTAASGGAGGKGGSGGGISVTGGTSGSGATPGDGGNPDDASTSDGEPPGVPTGCAAGTLSLSGTVQGAAVTIAINDVSPNWASVPGHVLVDFLGGFGGLRLAVEGALQNGVGLDRLTRDVTYSTSGWIFTPNNQTFYCVESGTLKRTAPGDVALNLSAELLGSCPGTPVAGQIVVCHDSPVAEDCTPSLSGSVEGIAFTDSSETILQIGPEGWFDFDNGLVIRFESNDLYLRELNTGVVDHALIVTPQGGAHGGSVYCAGASTWSRTPGPGGFGDHETFTLANLTKIGACSRTNEGTLAGCLREP